MISQGTEMNLGEPKYPSKKRRSMRQQAVRSKEWQMVLWQSDRLIVPGKSRKRDGGKGVAVTP